MVDASTDFLCPQECTDKKYILLESYCRGQRAALTHPTVLAAQHHTALSRTVAMTKMLSMCTGQNPQYARQAAPKHLKCSCHNPSTDFYYYNYFLRIPYMNNVCIVSTPASPTMLSPSQIHDFFHNYYYCYTDTEIHTHTHIHNLNLFIVVHMYTCLGLTPSD